MPPSDTEDLTGVMWNDRVWTSYFPLNENTVMDYFSLSQFYDPRCNNELIKMQRLDTSLMQTMAGIEYKLHLPCPAPNLFIITKSRRSVNPPSLEPLATYYIHEGNIYQSPSLHAILSSRILQSLHHMRNAFQTMQGAVTLSGQGKYVWDPPPLGEEPKTGEAMEHELMSVAERRAVDRMLYDVLEKNRKIAAAHEEKMQQADGAHEEETQRPHAPS